MARQHVQQFRVSPFAIESSNPTEGYWLSFAKELRLNYDEPGRPMVEVLADDDPRTYGLDRLVEDTSESARWETVNGSTMWARPLRPYDAIATGTAPFPIEMPALAEMLFCGATAAAEDRPGSRLSLDPELVWEDEATARGKTLKLAAVVAHDVRGRIDVDGWSQLVKEGLLGWVPAKVPVKAANVGPDNARFVTPSAAEMLWNGRKVPMSAVSREYIISRSQLASKWTEVGPDVEALAPIIWAYRFAVLLATTSEAYRIDRYGAKAYGCERLAGAGIHTVYDRLQRRDVDVALLDPEHPRHSELEIDPW